MLDTHTILHSLRRPKVLIRAARIGLSNYCRDTDLRFIARTNNTPPLGAALNGLIDREGSLEDSRKRGEAHYSVHEHIRVLTALLAEARLPKPA